ncbi:hypothetical protein SAMN05421659_10480 [[Clostridium] fimetarium]|uniref:Uncharacterized protein n=1 Tax=[Clostridium] fimetarium TaxID=99656 RepID=A0A1I0P1V5_9FIRM|nr:hypothetical protein SAMN05421659_10480 [[Clostridium] fimetarium]
MIKGRQNVDGLLFWDYYCRQIICIINMNMLYLPIYGDEITKLKAFDS